MWRIHGFVVWGSTTMILCHEHYNCLFSAYYNLQSHKYSWFNPGENIHFWNWNCHMQSFLRCHNFPLVLPFTLSWDEVLDLPTKNVTSPESWGMVLTNTSMWVRPNDLRMVWWVSRNSTPSLYQWMSISSSSTSTQNAAFSPSSTSTFLGSFRTIVPVKEVC